MKYKVDKISWTSTLQDFNVKRESEDICKLCKRTCPPELEFIGPVYIGDRYIDLCPKCARGVRNLMLRQDPNSVFPSEEVNRRYNKFISWLAQKGED